ncbi:hypothetical protein FQN55_002808 [Onygenales sp. PD_40]|nr:hypothetical protein FQN55_002808 [Onygenales sp. PD_40]KAK2777554.1 hypothetical protein FQN53_002212 [Emmonsiellopsis sp. PD_33]KAK2805697.1 hypothetical protein FQN51_009200 [Onygenales sp. PD_10]
MAPLVWLVTGCSSGFGEELINLIIARGDHAIATSRNVDRLEPQRFAGASVFELDVTAPQEEIDAKVLGALEIHGRIDVVVNNAGYIDVGTLEETSIEKYTAQFDTNVFGCIRVTQAVLPHFRQRRTGIFVFMGSMAGWTGDPFDSAYAASKFALEGIVESFQKEVAHLGIKCLLVEPGYFRTKLLERPQVAKASSEIDDYAVIVEPTHEHLVRASGRQPGDPRRGAEIIIDAVKRQGVCASREMPFRLPLGSDVLKTIREKCVDTLKLLDDWEDIGRLADFPEGT